MKKLLLPIFLSSLVSISYANYFDDWTNEDLCRWMDAASIPKHISEEVFTRQLSCYVSCYSGELTAQRHYCNENSNDLPGNMPSKDGRNGNQFSTNPVFNGIDMSGFKPPGLGSMDQRIYYINGYQQMGGTTYINSLKSYLESIGRGDVFSESPPGIQPPSPIKFNNQFSTNPVFNGIDMSGFKPPGLGSMDQRIYYINGYQQMGGTTYINSLKSYLESIGRGDVFSESPPEIQLHTPNKFNFKITF